MTVEPILLGVLVGWVLATVAVGIGVSIGRRMR